MGKYIGGENEMKRNLTEEAGRLSLLTRIKVRILGSPVFSFKENTYGKGNLDYYIVRCKKCGEYFLQYPHGYRRIFPHDNCNNTI